MRWFSALGTLLLATALNGLPAYPEPNAETVPTVIENTTPLTELQPSVNNTDKDGKKRRTIYLINVYSVIIPDSDENVDGVESVESDESDDVDEETLVTDLVEKIPEILDPVASVLLLVEQGAEDVPVDMDVIAKEFEAKGYGIQKFAKDGETRVILLDFIPDDSQNETDNAEDVADHAAKEDYGVDFIKPIETNMIRVRRKRAPCLKCYVDNTYRGNGYGQYNYPDYGRGGYQGGSIPVVVVPVDSGRRQYASQYPSGGGRGYRPGGDSRPCNGCQVQRGGGWSTSSSQASSQSASGHW